MRGSSALVDTNKKFYTRSYRPLQVQIFDFLTVFLKLFGYSQKYLAVPDILVSILTTGFGKLICLWEYAQIFFDSKSFGPRKSK